MEIDDSKSSRSNDPLALLIKQDLDPLSISELEGRISALKQEITRTTAKISTASTHRSVADALFTKG